MASGWRRLGAKTLAELRAMPTDKILDAAKNKRARPGFAPDIDGKFLTEPVPDTYAAGKQAHVPLLAGWNADEGSFFAMRGMTAAQWQGDGDKTVQRSRGGVPEALSRRDGCAGAALGDRFRQRPVHRLRDMEVAGGASQDAVTRRSTGITSNWPPCRASIIPELSRFHSDDIEYVFGTLDTRPGGTCAA